MGLLFFFFPFFFRRMSVLELETRVEDRGESADVAESACGQHHCSASSARLCPSRPGQEEVGRGGRGKKRRKKKKKKGAISNLRHKDKKRTTKERIEKGGIYRDTFTTLSLSFPPSSFPATFHFLLFGFIGRDF